MTNTKRPSAAPTSEEIIAKLGEPTRQLVENAIGWLEKTEPTWDLDTPMDRWDFIEGILEKMVSKEEDSQCPLSFLA